jgi:type IV secretion system protein VirB1
MFDIAVIIAQCAVNVAPSTMQAIITTESKSNPLAIGINKGYKLKYQPKSNDQAKAWVNYLEKNNFNFDVGLAQVNIKNIHRYGYKAADALNPCINLKMASDILRKNYKSAISGSRNQTEALQKALSAYNTGNYQSGFRNGYVQKIYANATVTTNMTNTPPIEKTSTKSAIKPYAQDRSKPHRQTIVYSRNFNAAADFY